MRAASLSAAYPPSAEKRSSIRPYSRTAPCCSPSTSSDIRACAFSMSRSSWSSPRAESTRSLAVTVRSPSRGS